MAPSRWFSLWAMAVVVVGLLILGWQIDRRTEAIAELEQATARIEEAASHSEQILVDTLAASDDEDPAAFQRRVSQAIREIREVKIILCDTLEEERTLAEEHRLCQEVTG